MITTLNKIRSYKLCKSGWVKLLKHLGKTKADNAPLSFLTILDSNELDETLWCLRAAPDDWMSNFRMYAIWCAKQVEHLMVDERSKNALVVAQNHALGLATDNELKAAARAAWAAAEDVAWDAAEDVARAAAGAAGDAARAAAFEAAWDAAWDVAWAAAWDDAAWAAGGAARDAARAAAWDAAAAAAANAAGAAGDAAWDAQKEMFIKMCKGEAPWQIQGEKKRA